MIRLHRLTLLIAGAGMLLLLVACGHNATGSGASQPGLNGTAGTAQLVKTGIVPTKVPPHSPTPTSPTQFAGKVALVIEAAPQKAGDSIVITLDNQTNQMISFPDHLTECTVALLQVQPINGGVWQAVALCKLGILTRLHTLAPGKSLTVTLVPPNGQWAAGLYRAQLSYVFPGTNRGLQTVYTQSFQV